jgi:hypothetical protein
MARKQLGMFDETWIQTVDAKAEQLGQTRRVFVQRAVDRALEAKPARVTAPDRPTGQNAPVSLASLRAHDDPRADRPAKLNQEKERKR